MNLKFIEGKKDGYQAADLSDITISCLFVLGNFYFYPAVVNNFLKVMSVAITLHSDY